MLLIGLFNFAVVILDTDVVLDLSPVVIMVEMLFMMHFFAVFKLISRLLARLLREQ